MSGLNVGGPSILPAMAMGQPQPEDEEEEQPPAPPGLPPIVDPKTGTPMFPQADGSIIIGQKMGAAEEPNGTGTFEKNLADGMDQMKRHQLAQDLLRGYRSDVDSRREYIQTLADGMDLLGVRIEMPRTSSMDGGAGAEGVSTQRSHLLLEAILRGQSNASAEMLPASGPVKVVDDGDETEERMVSAEALEKAMNHYLKPGGIATEYYPDTERLLFRTFYGGCCFKKVFRCPIRDRPVCESVSSDNLIINWGATDIANAARVTHRQMMQNHLVKSMQRLGQWRDCVLSAPAPQQTATERKEAELEGKTSTPNLPEDYPHTILEIYVDRDLEDYGIAARGQKRGQPVPYRIVIEEHSQEVLEVRRNWTEGDKLFRKGKMFVKYPLFPGFGFYDMGLVHLLGNDTMALTAMLRMTIDAGMFANFPGFLYSSLIGRQDSSIFRIPPGGGREIDTGGEPLANAVMKLPYDGPNAALIQLMDKVEASGQRLGSISEMPVGEGKQDAPVGTTIALIEQATKMVAAVHKRLHAAQAEEFAMLKDLFRQDPEALWRGEEESPLYDEQGEPPDEADVIKALEDFLISPQADPNVPSHMHRIMLATAVAQLATNNPLYNQLEVQKFLLRTIGVSAVDQLLNDPNDPSKQQPDPEAQNAQMESQLKQAQLQLKQMELQMKAGETQQKGLQIQQAGQIKTNQLGLQAMEREREGAMRMRELGIESQDRAADRESRERIAGMHINSDLTKNRSQVGLNVMKHQDQMGLDARQQQADMIQHQDRMAGDMAQHGDQIADNHMDRLFQHLQHTTPQAAPLQPPGPPTGGLGAA